MPETYPKLFTLSIFSAPCKGRPTATETAADAAEKAPYAARHTLKIYLPRQCAFAPRGKRQKAQKKPGRGKNYLTLNHGYTTMRIPLNNAATAVCDSRHKKIPAALPRGGEHSPLTI